MLYHSDEGSYHHPDSYGYKIFHLETPNVTRGSGVSYVAEDEVN